MRRLPTRVNPFIFSRFYFNAHLLLFIAVLLAAVLDEACASRTSASLGALSLTKAASSAGARQTGNQALGKPCKQSNDYGGFPAAKAVDGNVNTFQHTANPGDSWWQVDMLEPILVDRIVVENRRDCCQDRIFNAVVLLFVREPSGGGNVAALRSEAVWSATLAPQNGLTWTFTLGGARGQFIRVVANNNYLHIAELQAIGAPAVVGPAVMTWFVQDRVIATGAQNVVPRQIPDSPGSYPAYFTVAWWWTLQQGYEGSGGWHRTIWNRNSGFPSCLMRPYDNKMTCRITTTTTPNGGVFSNSLIEVGKPTHVALVLDRTQQTLYINGRVDAVWAFPGQFVVAGSGPWNIGGSSAQPSAPGIIQKMQYFSAPLPPDRILALFNEGLPPPVPTWISLNKLGTNPSSIALQVPHSQAFSMPMFSLVFWISVSDGPSGSWRTIIRKGNSQLENSPTLWLHPSTMKIQYCMSVAGTSNAMCTISAAAIPLIEPTLIGQVVDGTTSSLWINGRLDSQRSLNGLPPVVNLGPWQLGKCPWYPGFTGSLDKVQYFDAPIDAARMMKIYGEGPTRDLPVVGATAVQNVAIGKPTTQSSNYGGCPRFGAARANDNNNDTFSMTDEAPANWWQVDIGSVRVIRSIVIQNRMDCCQGRLYNAYVLGFKSPPQGPDLAHLKMEAVWFGQMVKSQDNQLTWAFDMGAQGKQLQFVRVVLLTGQALALAEVMVNAEVGGGSDAAGVCSPATYDQALQQLIDKVATSYGALQSQLQQRERANPNTIYLFPKQRRSLWEADQRRKDRDAARKAGNQ